MKSSEKFVIRYMNSERLIGLAFGLSQTNEH